MNAFKHIIYLRGRSVFLLFTDEEIEVPGT